MSDVIDFPTHKPVERSVDEIHAEAFRELESHISDCLSMSEIAFRMMPDEADGTLRFAVHEAKEKLRRLQELYYRLHSGEEQPAG